MELIGSTAQALEGNEKEAFDKLDTRPGKKI